ncbi:hypothetical protein D3C87_1673990 [compost metagenome]
MVLDAGDGAGDPRRVRQSRTGDAVHRDVIDEAGGVVEHGWETLLVRGRCRQADEVDALGERRDAEFVIHFRRQINDDQAIDTGFDRIIKESIDAVDVDRVVITHHDDRRVAVVLAEIAGEVERLCQSLAALQGALAGELDSRAIRHRIGKRHAEFDHVGTGFRQGLHDAE